MIYFYDGTKNGFLTAFVSAYSDESAVVTARNAQLSMGQKSIFVHTNQAKAKKAEKRISSFDKDALADLDYLLRSGEDNADMVAFRYLLFLTKEQRPVRNMLAVRDVFSAMECIRRVTYEIHRMHGLLRFIESASGALYAPITTDNDISDLLVPHFRARLPHYPFVIHDVSRKKAAIYDGEHVFTAPLERTDVLLAADETAWQNLFRQYYQSVNIPERERLKQMRGLMPVRYWKYLPEKYQSNS